LNSLMAEHTGQPLAKIAEDTDSAITFLSPPEAVAYGLIDRVVDDETPADAEPWEPAWAEPYRCIDAIALPARFRRSFPLRSEASA